MKEINEKEVMTESGETVPYTQLVLATGSLWNGVLALPDTRVEAIEQLRSFRKKLDAAENVLIIGGGAIGVGEHWLSYFISGLCLRLRPQNTPEK